jgi:regulator of sigma D
MEFILGILFGVIIILGLMGLSYYYKQRVDKTEKQINQIYSNIMDMQENIIEFEDKLYKIKVNDDKIKMLEEELKIEKKYNGLNFQKVFKDVIKLREHLTYMSNK